MSFFGTAAKRLELISAVGVVALRGFAEPGAERPEQRYGSHARADRQHEVAQKQRADRKRDREEQIGRDLEPRAADLPTHRTSL
ncbi:MAG: hypothetical protein ACRDLN_06005 [Solirubrobacteraceae bacterium]